jgi:murein L,D-transpeptidase YcbB/YkuD
MKRALIPLVAVALCTPAASAQEPAPHWSGANIDTLKRWALLAPQDALPRLSAAALDDAMTEGDEPLVNRIATELALRLARMQLLGCAAAGERKDWNIADSDRSIDLEPLLRRSLEAGTLDAFYAGVMPRNADYAALRADYAKEADPAKRATIARNMERWRWMPRSLGDDYVLVNAAVPEAQLWREGAKIGTWKVPVAGPRAPAPAFDAMIVDDASLPAQVAAALASGRGPNAADPSRSLRVYVTYFTAVEDGHWGVRILPDSAGRDSSIVADRTAAGCSA